MTEPIRIGTWNVERASVVKNPQRLEVLRGANADIWILTETRDELDLRPEYTGLSSQSRYRTVEPPRWVTIWSRFRLREQVHVEDTRRTVAGIYETPLGPLLVYGTVLPWHSDRDPEDTKNWAKHHRVIPKQGEEWAALSNQHSGVALCVAGDVNMNLGGRYYYGTKEGARLLEGGLLKANLACVTRTEMVPAGRLAKPHIDHICLPISWAERTHVVEAWPGTTAEGVRLSDHSGIVVQVNPPAPAVA